MAVHELGHIAGAIVTGGSVQRVVLYPLTISRTDVSPNPHPAIVVWLGPIIGCMLPLGLFAIVPQRLKVMRKIARFFAGFCLIANGAYISIGSLNQIGDCREMLRTGTPLWVLLVFGIVAISLGLYLWSGLGSVKHFIDHPEFITPPMAYVVAGLLFVVVAAGFAFFPR